MELSGQLCLCPYIFGSGTLLFFFFLCAVVFYVVLLGSVEGPATQDPHQNPLGFPFLYVTLCETFQGSDLGFVLRHTSITMALVIFL